MRTECALIKNLDEVMRKDEACMRTACEFHARLEAGPPRNSTLDVHEKMNPPEGAGFNRVNSPKWFHVMLGVG